MKAMPIAAAAPESTAVGRFQYSALATTLPPTAASDTSNSKLGLPMTDGMAATPNALISPGTTVCQRRSRRRSELRPSTSMPTTASAKGAATIQPICTVSLTPASRNMLGIQNTRVTPARNAKLMTASNHTRGERMA